MSFLARFKRRYMILKGLLEQANEMEYYFPYAVNAGIGVNVVHWGYVEHMLDLLIIWHSHTRLGDERKDHPRALNRKLDYLKHMEKDETLEVNDRATIRIVRLSAADISERRHDFTHSFMDIEHTHSEWSFKRFQYEGKNVRLLQKTYDLQKLSALTEEIRVLVGQLSPLTESLALVWMKSNRSLFVSS